MASVTSLGIHKPSAIPFLVTEGILPSDPPEDAYTWQTFQQHDAHGVCVEEELIYTDYCVVWSRGGLIERVFRFDVEEERVAHAVFAHFPNKSEVHTSPRGSVSSPSQNKQRKSTADAELKVPRQRRLKSVSTPGTRTIVAHHQKTISRHDRDIEEQSLGDRALVVVLKTQAHIFLLSKTSHIVHLPFEVDAVFPSVRGILLQRKIPDLDAKQASPQIPSAPQNTFFYSRSNMPDVISSFHQSYTVARVPREDIVSAPFSALLKKLQSAPSQSRDVRLPRLYCLVDPLVEIGTVVTKNGPKARNSPGLDHFETSEFRSLDIREQLLYVSPRNELAGTRSAHDNSEPLILAVTENEENGTISIWNVEYLDRQSSSRRQHPPSHNHGRNYSRRRSSYGPGMGTGTTTPVARSHRHGSKDPALDEDSAHDQESFLDPTFGNPTTKSSRRVSSLLARADLSSNHDRSAFTDLAAGQPVTRSNRRGLSSGSLAPRLSSGPDDEAIFSKPQPLRGLRTSLNSVTLHDIPIDDPMDELDDMHGLGGLGNPDLDKVLRDLRKEIVFQRVFSTASRSRRHRSLPVTGKRQPLEIMTMKAPGPVDGHTSGTVEIVISVMDRMANELVSLQMSALITPRSRRSIKNATNIPRYNFRVNTTVRSGVIDACKVSEGNIDRILMLELGSAATKELSLHAPWTLPQKIDLPLPLNLYDAHQISNELNLRKHREGSLKRVISQGPNELSLLQNGNCEGCVDIVDSDNIRHRVQIRFQPSNPFIQQIIKISEAVLPASCAEGQALVRGWCEVMVWLRSRGEPDTDMEWTAMIVVLFSMGVPFIDDRRTEATPRQRRRKGGLLRSSSGANTDLESWETMLARESSSSATSPGWMQNGAWKWTGKDMPPLSSISQKPRSSNPWPTSATPTVPIPKKSSSLLHCVSLARDFTSSPIGRTANGDYGYMPTASSKNESVRRTALASVLVALHLFREELKLDILTAEALHRLTPVLAQIGTWLRWQNWGFNDNSYYMRESMEIDAWLPEESAITGLKVPPEPFPPPSILQFIEMKMKRNEVAPFTTILDVVGIPEDATSAEESENLAQDLLLELTPRTTLIIDLLASHAPQSVETRVSQMNYWGIDLSFLETLPESLAAPFRTAMSACQTKPSTAWNSRVLQVIGRDDLAMLERPKHSRGFYGKSSMASNDALRDVHSVCHLALEAETVGPYDWSAEVDRQAITRLLFKEDQRFAEAEKLVHPLIPPTAKCAPEPGWSETELLEAQQELAKVVALRTLAVSAGRSLLFYCARSPLLTEKFPIHGFTLSCIMKPTDTTITADRVAFVEEKVSWAFFHAGVEAGLSISKDAKGVDTSWILFNKPRELTNRHAGFLLALGLNGHLRSIAKWVAFKYLTPKHTMTSIGLLLGLSASYLGTMDTLITRLLSVHVTRMLPPGAAELNLSPLTQTGGIMGIGLLYCNTQHRRMSEIMLSEMENVDQDDSANPLEALRDEGYRLAAGFALGYINIARGKDLRGLHDMHITERLLTLAIATKRVDLIHIVDKATAGATIAIALIFMKTQDQALARRVDIPDTVHQFDYTRPDQFMLRTVARHLIMWDDIQPSAEWITQQMPGVYRQTPKLSTIKILTSENLAFFNILAGICFSIGLRYAGSGSVEVRDLLCQYLDHLIRICRLPTLNYDGKLARIAVRNCQDVVALSAACIMAGTGDLIIFRRLRSLRGRTDPDTPYGSHLATHLAIGILFLGGGTHTFGTSNIAVASLLCAFYPLFPAQVLDNKSHLQAFRHFWVLATERRCLIPRDADTHRPLSLPILVTLHDGASISLKAPCLLPDLSKVAEVQTNDPESWTVTLDFSNPAHLAAFDRHQSIYVRRRAAYDNQASVFSATMQALNDTQSAPYKRHQQAFEWIFSLSAFAGLDRTARALVLPAETGREVFRGTRGTVVDDRLVLEKACLGSTRSERLWNLRLLFAWAEGEEGKGKGGWIEDEVVEGLRAALALRRRAARGK